MSQDRSLRLPPCQFCGNPPKSTTDDTGVTRVFCPSCMWTGMSEAEWKGLAYGNEDSRQIRNALVQVMPLATAYAKTMPSKDNQARVAIASSLLLNPGMYGMLEVIDHTAIAEAELRGFRMAVERASRHCCEKCGLPQTSITSMAK